MTSLFPLRIRSLLSLAAIGLTLAASMPAALAGLDLSPQVQSYELEGIPMSQLAFNNGAMGKATYQPPRDWKYSGGSDRFELQPGNKAQTKASLSKWPSSPAISFDPQGLAQLNERIIGMLPEGSEQVKVLAAELNPLQIDGKPTYLVEVSYVFYGERFCSYSLLLDRTPEPLFFRLSSRESDYATLREAFQRSLYTWQNL